MKLFLCKVCGHIEFNQAPQRCPVCGAPQSAFVESPAAIKQPANPAALSDGDKKHIPQIVIAKACGLIPGGGCNDVHVRVGEIEHVMKPDHFIRWLDFYVDQQFISRVTLAPEKCHPAAALHLAVNSGQVTVIENCNIHGHWMSTAAL